MGFEEDEVYWGSERDMLTDYHTHTERGPYTVAWLERFLDMAQVRGIAEYGVSEHGYRFVQAAHLLDNAWTRERRTQDIEAYIDMVAKARAAGHEVKLGLELDYIPGMESKLEAFIRQYPFDYVIGSVHWLGDFGFDLLEMKSMWETQDLKQIYDQYFATLTQMVESELFDFVGHADVIKVFGYEPQDAVFLGDWYDRLVEAFKRHGSVIEISTAGLRKPVGKMYPAPGLLHRCSAAGVPIVLNSDAHRPEDVGADYDQAIDYAREAGYETLTVFTRRERSLRSIG